MTNLCRKEATNSSQSAVTCIKAMQKTRTISVPMWKLGSGGEVIILCVNGRVTTEVYHSIVFLWLCVVWCLQVFKSVLTMMIIVDLMYTILCLAFTICSIHLRFVTVAWQHFVSHVLNILLRIVVWIMASWTCHTEKQGHKRGKS
jgi:hypothetical protein